MNLNAQKRPLTICCPRARKFQRRAGGQHSQRTSLLPRFVLDRNLRANLAYGDCLCAADIWNNGEMYDYLNGTPTDPNTWIAAPANGRAGDADTRVKTLRRLVLAYGTDGTPLHYLWEGIGMSLSLVYFRAVDTSTPAPLPGSGATSDKILLSFVNFDTSPGPWTRGEADPRFHGVSGTRQIGRVYSGQAEVTASPSREKAGDATFLVTSLPGIRGRKDMPCH